MGFNLMTVSAKLVVEVVCSVSFWYECFLCIFTRFLNVNIVTWKMATQQTIIIKKKVTRKKACHWLQGIAVYTLHQRLYDGLVKLCNKHFCS